MSHIITTDASFHAKHRVAGWAAVIEVEGQIRTESGVLEAIDSNNTAELAAVCHALELFSGESGLSIEVRTDSAYVMHCHKHMHTLRLEGWSKRRHVAKDQPLIQTMWSHCQRHNVSFQMLKGHAGDFMNNQADKAARKTVAHLLPAKLPRKKPKAKTKTKTHKQSRGKYDGSWDRPINAFFSAGKKIEVLFNGQTREATLCAFPSGALFYVSPFTGKQVAF